MRTIKFRVYDNLSKKYIQENIVYMLGALVNGKLVISADDDGEILRHHYLEQFTGLHDKNGVEIYEGDKLLMKDEIGNSGIVTVGFENGGFIVFRGLAWRQIGDYDVEKNTIEIIGNIHEEELE